MPHGRAAAGFEIFQWEVDSCRPHGKREVPIANIVNIGGEGEVAGAINLQGRWALDPAWRSISGQTLGQLQVQGAQIVIVDNLALPFAAGSATTVITNNVPINVTTFIGPGVQSSEVWRILSVEGSWFNNGVRMARP